MKLSNLQISQKVQQKIANCLDNDKEFSLSLSEIKQLFSVQHCAYTGKRFSTFQDMTWERINPEVDYVSGNVIIVSQAANTHKSQLDAFVKGAMHPIRNED
jgi:hypothetical protein